MPAALAGPPVADPGDPARTPDENLSGTGAAPPAPSFAPIIEACDPALRPESPDPSSSSSSAAMASRPNLLRAGGRCPGPCVDLRDADGGLAGRDPGGRGGVPSGAGLGRLDAATASWLSTEVVRDRCGAPRDVPVLVVASKPGPRVWARLRAALQDGRSVGRVAHRGTSLFACHAAVGTERATSKSTTSAQAKASLVHLRGQQGNVLGLQLFALLRSAQHLPRPLLLPNRLRGWGRLQGRCRFVVIHRHRRDLPSVREQMKSCTRDRGC